jgi:HlyD family secretion protein
VRERDTLIEMDDRAYRRSLERARIALLGSQIEYATQVHSPFLGVADSAAAAKLLNEACNQLSLLRDDPHLRAGDARDVERRIRHWEAEVAYHSSDRLDVLAHKSGLSEAREAFERAQEDFAQTIIVAPFAGQLTDIRAVPQQYLHQGDVLCTLVDPASLVFEADILESELARIREGQQVDVELLGYPGRILRAVVSAVNPRVAPDGRGIRLQASFARDLTNRTIRVFPGMYAKGTLHTAIVNNGVVIPRDAVLVRNDRNVVFVVRGGRAEWRYVETGARNDTEIQILQGVHPGERVIVEGHATLVHQAPVIERP